MLAQTNATGIVRDLNNNALLANDISMLNSHREQIQECLSLRDEIIEIKQMLYNHIQRDNKWQA